MKKKILLLIGCFSIGLWAGAQTSDPSLISAAGEISQGETMTLQWTLGEKMIETHTTENGMLTEGFIQPTLEIIEISKSIFGEEIPNAQDDTQVKIWPTPVSDFLNIQVQGTQESNILVNLYDIHGKRVLTQSLDMAVETNALDLEMIIAGNYVLRVSNADGKHIESFIIIKITQ